MASGREGDAALASQEDGELERRLQRLAPALLRQFADDLAVERRRSAALRRELAKVRTQHGPVEYRLAIEARRRLPQ